VHLGERRLKFHFWEHYCVFAYQADHPTRRWHYRLRRAPYLVALTLALKKLAANACRLSEASEKVIVWLAGAKSNNAQVE
jgi:hypothetical protein